MGTYTTRIATETYLCCISSVLPGPHVSVISFLTISQLPRLTCVGHWLYGRTRYKPISQLEVL